MQDGNSSHVQVESVNDAIDIEVYDRHQRLTVAIQCKTRGTERTWSSREIIDELKRWEPISKLHPNATYIFYTNGRPGRSATQLIDLINDPKGQQKDASTLQGEILPEFLTEDFTQRFRIQFNEPSTQTLFQKAETLTISLFKNTVSERQALEKSRAIVATLCKMITLKSGEADPAERKITTQEISELFEETEYTPTTTWNARLKQNLITKIHTQNQAEGNERQLNDRIIYADKDQSYVTDRIDRELHELCQNEELILVSGAAGSGKSTVLNVTQRRLATQGQLLLIADANGYQKGRIGQLVSQSIDAIDYHGVYPATGLKAAEDGELTIALDNVTEIDKDSFQALITEVRYLINSQNHAKLILCGRSASQLKRALPNGRKTTSVSPARPDEAEQLAICEQNRDHASRYSSSEILARARRMARDAGTNRLILTLAARAISKDIEVSDTSTLYHKICQDYLETASIEDTSLYLGFLGIICTEILKANRYDASSLDWLKLMRTASTQMNGGTSDDLTEIFNRVLNSGLLRRSDNDRIKFAHDSFVDYLAAYAIHHGLAANDLILNPLRTEAAVHYAQLGGITTEEVRQIASSHPLFLSRIARYETNADATCWPTEIRETITKIIPERNIPSICCWEFDNQVYATLNSKVSGWSETPVLCDPQSNEFSMQVSPGPASVVIEIWKRDLQERVERYPKEASTYPSSKEEIHIFLDYYSRRRAALLEEFIQELVPTPHQDEIRRTIGPFWLSFSPFEFPTDSRHASQIALTYTHTYDPEQLITANIGFEDHCTGTISQTSLRSFIDTSPRDSAYATLLDAFNTLSQTDTWSTK